MSSIRPVLATFIEKWAIIRDAPNSLSLASKLPSHQDDVFLISCGRAKQQKLPARGLCSVKDRCRGEQEPKWVHTGMTKRTAMFPAIFFASHPIAAFLFSFHWIM